MKWLCRVVALVLSLGPARSTQAALPAEITVTVPTKLELLRGDKVSGMIGLAVGERLALVDLTGDYALVRYRNLNGRVPMGATDAPRPEVAPVESAAPVPAATSATVSAAAVAPVGAPNAPPASAAIASASHAPANALERALAGKLVQFENGALRPADGARLAGVKFYALYFSASWCAPCREFTPGFVDAYGKIRALYPEFEVVLVSSDRSQPDMAAYMRDDHMTWPALRWDAIQASRAITRYCGDGIPCLVLVDENGKVLSDTNRRGSYVGPDAVLEDTWKILRDYRRKNPRPKA